MDHKKVYTAISAAMGVVFLYSLGWTVKFWLSEGFHIGGVAYWINTFFGFFGMAGLIIFISSKFKNSVILRIYMCKMILTLPDNIIYHYTVFSNSEMRNKVDGRIYFGMTVILIMIVSCIIGLWLLTRQRTPKLKHYMIGSESAVAEFSPVSAWTRVANYATDLAMIYYASYTFWQGLRYVAAITRRGYREYDQGFPVEFIPLLIVLLYYFILEGIFNTTAGKCATNTVIVNSSGEIPSAGQRLGRTLCRLIPFEAFSFLGKNARGWHDTITDTYVVASADKYEEKEREDELSGFLTEQE
jgi:uncharacterized RDD family membrane protein YckC